MEQVAAAVYLTWTRSFTPERNSMSIWSANTSCKRSECIVTTTHSQFNWVNRIDFKGCELRIYAWYSFSFPLKAKVLHTHTHTHKTLPTMITQKAKFPAFKIALVCITFSCSMNACISRFRLSHSIIYLNHHLTESGMNIHFGLFASLFRSVSVSVSVSISYIRFAHTVYNVNSGVWASECVFVFAVQNHFAVNLL